MNDYTVKDLRSSAQVPVAPPAVPTVDELVVWLDGRVRPERIGSDEGWGPDRSAEGLHDEVTPAVGRDLALARSLLVRVHTIWQRAEVRWDAAPDHDRRTTGFEAKKWQQAHFGVRHAVEKLETLAP